MDSGPSRRHHTGKDIRRFIGKEIVSKFGAPKLLITDGGPKLVANATKVYLAKQGIGQNVTTPYHPQANGRVEQLNGSLTQALAKLTAENPPPGRSIYRLPSWSAGSA